MNGQAQVFLALVVFQFLAAVAFIGVYLREPGWRKSAVGRHLLYWVAATGASDLSWLLLLVVRWPWLVYALFGAQFAVGALGWYRIWLVLKTRR